LKLSTSCLSILPPGPDPLTALKSIPFSPAMLLARGLATTLPDELELTEEATGVSTFAGAGVAAGVGALVAAGAGEADV